MFRRFVSSRHPIARRLIVASLLAAGLSSLSVSQTQDTAKRGRKYKAPPPTAHFEVTVTRATNGKPVENASVIFHPLADGRDNGNMELKTNDEGKAVIDLLEIGSNVRLQIIAPGFQTYGEDYKVDKDNVAVAVKLQRPSSQYSIYKKGEGITPDKSADKSTDKSTDKSKDATAPPASTEPQKDTPKDAPKDESKPQDSTPK